MNSRGDSELISSALKEVDELRDNIKTNVLKRRREHMLVLSVDSEISEDTV